MSSTAFAPPGAAAPVAHKGQRPSYLLVAAFVTGAVATTAVRGGSIEIPSPVGTVRIEIPLTNAREPRNATVVAKTMPDLPARTAVVCEGSDLAGRTLGIFGPEGTRALTVQTSKFRACQPDERSKETIYLHADELSLIFPGGGPGLKQDALASVIDRIPSDLWAHPEARPPAGTMPLASSAKH